MYAGLAPHRDKAEVGRQGRNKRFVDTVASIRVTGIVLGWLDAVDESKACKFKNLFVRGKRSRDTVESRA